MASSVTQSGSHDQDSEKAYESNQTESRSRQRVAARQGFGARSKRHCVRWWWVHIIIFCICFLIIALCLVYVGMPRIAQHGVNESHLQLTDLEFHNPTPDFVTMTQKAILHSPSMYTPTLDAFNATLWLVTNGTFATESMNMLPMPRIHALHPTSNTSVVDQTVAIENLDQITQYTIQVLVNENVTVGLTGKTTLHEGHLPSTKINYNTTVTYAALNGLAGFNVTGAKANLTAPPGEPNLSGFAYIPNPSLITIAMGNVTLSLATAAAGVIGNATILEMTVVPGNNTLPLTAIVDQDKVISSMDKNGFVDMIITGTSSVYNGQHIPYYEKALASNVLHLSMNIEQILADSGSAS